MNKARILELADVIENKKLDLKFDMEEYAWSSSCGTAACIAGWAGALYKPDYFKKYLLHDPQERMFDTGKRVLGLCDADAKELFCPQSVQLHRITAEVAVSTLRHFAETGEVVWPDYD